MPKYQVQAPDGSTYEYDVPEGTDPQAVVAHAQQSFVPKNEQNYEAGQVQSVDIPASSAPQQDEANWYRNADGTAKNIGQQAQETLGGIAQGIAKPFDNAANGLAHLFGQSAPAAAQAATASLPANEPGRFIGNMIGTAPAAMLPGGVLAQGAAGGALLSDATDPVGLGIDALIGAGGAGLVGLLGHGLAGAATPKPVSDSLRTLMNESIRITPGQAARGAGGEIGGMLPENASKLSRAGARRARAEDLNTSLPIAGDLIQGDRMTAHEDFARATINRAVSVLPDPVTGAPLNIPERLGTGRRAIEWAGNRLSDAYDRLLPKLAVAGDDQFTSELANIHSDVATELLPARAKQFDNILKGMGRFWQQGTNLDGAGIKEIESRLTRLKGRFQSSPDADQQQLGDAIEAVHESLRDLVARQNPQFSEELTSLNKGWKSLVQVERAAGNSKAAITPAGYSQAVKMSSDTLRRRGYSRGTALNQDLADAASEILPSGVPDSGTAPRSINSTKRANVVGAIKGGAYLAKKAALPSQLNQQFTSQALADLIRFGTPIAAIAAPAGIKEAGY